jgi:hypothetical protein
MVRNISSNHSRQARHRVSLSPKIFPLPILAVRFSQSDELSLRDVLRKVNRFRYPVLPGKHTLSTAGALDLEGCPFWGGYFSSVPRFPREANARIVRLRLSKNPTDGRFRWGYFRHLIRHVLDLTRARPGRADYGSSFLSSSMSSIQSCKLKSARAGLVR